MSPPSSSLSNIHITSDTLTAGAILDLQVLNCALFLAHFQSVAMPNPVLSLFNLCPASVRDGFGFASFGHNTAQAARATQAYFTPTLCSGISHPTRGSISLTSYGHFFLARLSHSSVQSYAPRYITANLIHSAVLKLLPLSGRQN